MSSNPGNQISATFAVPSSFIMKTCLVGFFSNHNLNVLGVECWLGRYRAKRVVNFVFNASWQQYVSGRLGCARQPALGRVSSGLVQTSCKPDQAFP